MLGWRRATACDRAAQRISLDLDGELDGRGQAALARHLGRCPDCSRLQEAMTAVTYTLRIAPAEAPARPIVLPETSLRRSRLPRGVAPVVALAAACTAGAALFAVPQGSPPAPSTALASATLAQRVQFARAQQARIDPAPQRHVRVVPVPRPAAPSLACSQICWETSGL